jgi:GWxTD domain-containing protein
MASGHPSFSDSPARSRPGARVVLAPLALFAALALTAGVARAADEGPGPLPWRVGGRVGFSVDAATFPDSAGYVLEVYLRIPSGTLTTLTRDAGGTARLRLSLRLQGPYARNPQLAEQELAVAPGDTAGGFGKVVALKLPVRPGQHRLQVRLEDVLSRKRGLVYSGRSAREFGAIAGGLEVPAPQAGRDLSDLEFVWEERQMGGPTAFRHGDRTLLPNPERLYGLFATELRAHFVARSRVGDGRPWRWVARVLDAAGQVIAERESTAAAGRWLSGSVAFDLSTVPAGGYDLEVKAWQEGDPGALLRRARFGIAWQVDSWLRNPREIEDNAHFLLEARAEEDFARMNPGEQERYIEDFWRERDPSPGTAVNEARETYLQRVDFANRTYGHPSLVKGMFSDMGRVFIRYGEPSEVLRQVIPAGDETLLQAVRQLSLTEDRPIGDVEQKGYGGDIRPFEIWIYEGQIPPPPDADPRQAPMLRLRKRLVFLFVDEQGLGDFRLRYSTE